MYDEVQIVMCGVWTWWWAWLWRWAVVVAVAVGVAVAVVVGVVVAVAVTSGGNCARSALTCLNCTTPEGITSRAATVPGGKLCAQRTDLLLLRLPDALLYPRIRWSALFRGYACLSGACQARFFTREFDGLPCFAGMRAASAVAGCASLPANSIVCLVSRVCLLVCSVHGSLLYPRIR